MYYKNDREIKQLINFKQDQNIKTDTEKYFVSFIKYLRKINFSVFNKQSLVVLFVHKKYYKVKL